MSNKLKVFKFGGASVKDVEGVKNMAAILQKYTGEPLVIVVSAMGKSTVKLEKNNRCPCPTNRRGTAPF